MNTIKCNLRRPHNVVGIVTCLRAGRSGFRITAEARDVTLLQYVQTVLGFQPASYWMGTRSSFPGVNRPWHDANHSLPFSAKVKSEWGYTAIPPVYLYGAFTFLPLLNMCSNTESHSHREILASTLKHPNLKFVTKFSALPEVILKEGGGACIKHESLSAAIVIVRMQ
jgi:hypothetical protein